MAKAARRKAQQKKNNYLLGGIIGLVVLGLGVVWLMSRNTPSAGSMPLEISVQEAVAKQKAGAFILDVREPDEWNTVHIAGATLIPLGELDSRLNELPKDKEIVVVCHSGNRSAKGRDILLNNGFTQVTSMAGGMNQWQAAGYPTVSGP
ncbi:MAG: rhodanese-like domain-containing protein [Bacteroidota bacterium]